MKTAIKSMNNTTSASTNSLTAELIAELMELTTEQRREVWAMWKEHKTAADRRKDNGTY